MEKLLAIYSMMISSLKSAQALYGYKCGIDTSNITTISVVDVGDCNIDQPKLNISKEYIQLLQLNDFSMTRVSICSVKVPRTITNCGNIALYAARVSNGEITYFKNITRDKCSILQRSGFYNIGEVKIDNIKGNSTTSRPITSAGSTKIEGKCTEGSYSDI